MRYRFRNYKFKAIHTISMFLSPILQSSLSMPRSIWGREEGIPRFGHEIRTFFLFGNDKSSETVAFCNHGARGATPIHVIEKRFELIKSLHMNPDRWFQAEMPRMEESAIKKLANFIGANSSSDLVFVNSVTEGINTVLKVKYYLR